MGSRAGQKFECNDLPVGRQVSISSFKIGSGRAEEIVSPDCRPPSIITAPKPGKILSEPCGTERKSHSSKHAGA